VAKAAKAKLQVLLMPADRTTTLRVEHIVYRVWVGGF
jgi:hypothetical protein